MFSQFVLELK